MIYFYTFLYILALIFYFPVFIIRVRWIKREKLELRPRFGLKLPPPADGRVCLWLHAVSVGEVFSLPRLVGRLRERHPSWRIVVTSLTPSGVRLAREKLSQLAEVAVVPLDLPWCWSRFWRQLRPSVLGLVESEFWPNLLFLARKKSLPVVLINGRISERSFRRIRRLRAIFLPWLETINVFLMQSEKDRQRLLRIGVKPEKISVIGNLKSDVALPEWPEEEKAIWRKKLGLQSEHKLITAGSTHPGEEAIFLKALAAVIPNNPNLRLVIAPRHPERWEEVASLSASYSFSWTRWSFFLNQADQPESTPHQWQVLIVDTLGDLPLFYSLADLTFVGGSLVARGGHNLLEPAFYGKPILFGPYMDNFAALTDAFLQGEAALRVRNETDLVEAIKRMETVEFQKMGEKAKEILRNLQGATEKTISVLESLIGERQTESAVKK